MAKDNKSRQVERNAELRNLDRILARPVPEGEIVWITGPGGIGKTWLLSSMLNRVPKSGVLALQAPLDMYDTAHQHVEGVVNSIMTMLQPDCPEFDRASQALVELRARKPRASEEEIQAAVRQLTKAFRACLADFGRNLKIVLGFDTFEHVQDGPVGRWLLSPEGLRMPNVVCIIASRKTSAEAKKLRGLNDKEALDLYFKYSLDQDSRRDRRTREKVKSLNAKAEGNPLLVGLASLVLWDKRDSTDLVNLSLEALRESVVRPLHSLSDEKRRVGGLELNEAMYQTLGCMSYLNRRFNPFFLSRLVAEGYVRLGGMTEEDIWRRLKQESFFFVKERPANEVQLHDILAELMRKYLLADVLGEIELGEKWLRLSNDVLRWYDELLALPPSAKMRDFLLAEKLAYVLRLDAPEGYTEPDYLYAVQLLDEYRRERSDVLHRLLISILSPSVVTEKLKLPEAPSDEHYAFYRHLGKIALDEHYLAESRFYWDRARELATRQGLERRQAEALIGLHNSTLQNDPETSLKLLAQASVLAKGDKELSAEVKYETGYTYRRLDDLERALQYYEEAQADCSDRALKATILNDMGYARLMVGNYTEAREEVEEARRLREKVLNRIILLLNQLNEGSAAQKDPVLAAELEGQRHEAALKLGMSANTLGQLERFDDDLTASTANYSQAYLVFREEGSLFWQARALFSRGEAHRRIAWKLADRSRPAYDKYDLQAQRDLELSLQLCQEYGFDSIIQTAYRRLGRLWHDRALRVKDRADKLIKLEKARGYFEQGFAAAIASQDTLEELENLKELAFLTDDRMSARYPGGCPAEESCADRTDIERFRRGIKRHKDDEHRIYQFEVFRHLLELEEGAYHFELRESDKALRFYLAGYLGLAADPGYGYSQYVLYIGHLFSNMERLSGARQREWCQKFIQKMRSTRMQRGDPCSVEAAHPDLRKKFTLWLDDVEADSKQS